VFGSPDQSTQWLQSLFHVGQTSSSGGIRAPDTSHPMLTTPESLNFDQYSTSGKGWKYTGGADDHFTDVVTQGSTPVTAISDPGDFGEGTIIMTSWRPYDLFGGGAGTSGTEGLAIMFNLLMQDSGTCSSTMARPFLTEHPSFRPLVSQSCIIQVWVQFRWTWCCIFSPANLQIFAQTVHVQRSTIYCSPSLDGPLSV
jgi:hypothetical protein